MNNKKLLKFYKALGDYALENKLHIIVDFNIEKSLFNAEVLKQGKSFAQVDIKISALASSGGVGIDHDQRNESHVIEFQQFAKKYGI